MNVFKSSLNALAICGGVLAAGLIVLISGVLSYFDYSNATDIYTTSYDEYLIEDEPVTGSIWSVECNLGVSEDGYNYALIPVSDRDSYKISEDIKFVVYCYDDTKKMAVSSMIKYWNAETEKQPDDIEFCGIVTPASNEISEKVYAYFSEVLQADKEQADIHYLPYVITDVDDFSYAYLPKIIIGIVMCAIAVALYYFLIVKKEKDNKVFTFADLPDDYK